MKERRVVWSTLCQRASVPAGPSSQARATPSVSNFEYEPAISCNGYPEFLRMDHLCAGNQNDSQSSACHIRPLLHEEISLDEAGRGESG